MNPSILFNLYLKVFNTILYTQLTLLFLSFLSLFLLLPGFHTRKITKIRITAKIAVLIITPIAESFGSGSGATSAASTTLVKNKKEKIKFNTTIL